MIGLVGTWSGVSAGEVVREVTEVGEVVGEVAEVVGELAEVAGDVAEVVGELTEVVEDIAKVVGEIAEVPDAGVVTSTSYCAPSSPARRGLMRALTSKEILTAPGRG